MLKHPSILVTGDLILDRYIEGTARMSAEATCPIFTESGAAPRYQLGGAAAVAAMCAALGAKVSLAGIVGYGLGPAYADVIYEACDLAGIDRRLVAYDSSRPLTVKTRYVSPTGQHIRIDRETTEPWKLKAAGLDALARAAAEADIVLVCDYGKGAITFEVMAVLTKTNGRVIVDPARGRHWTYYGHPWGIKANSDEANAVMYSTDYCDWWIVTLGADGLNLFAGDGSKKRIPARTRAVRDVTGAGDQVLAVLGCCLASGLPLLTAAEWANAAAGLCCEKVGATPVTREELLREMQGDDLTEACAVGIVKRSEVLREMHGHVEFGYLCADGGKTISAEDAAWIAARNKGVGRRVVFTNGCFDLLHAGHVSILREAKEQGDFLFVGLNSDKSVRALKGEGRPIRPQAERAAVLEALACVDYVVIFDEPTPAALIEKVCPDVLVKGGDYSPEDVIGRHFVESRGGRVHIAKYVDGISTSAIVEAMR